MLVNELSVLRGLNEDLCRRVSRFNMLNVSVIHPIGNAGPGGELLIRVAKSRKGKKSLPIPNCVRAGSSLFLVKCKIPYDDLRFDGYLNNMIGGVKYPFMKLHLYLLVGIGNLTKFLWNIYMQDFPCTILNMSSYGEIILVRIKGTCALDQKFYGGKFDELHVLRNIVGLDANFVVEGNDAIVSRNNSICAACGNDGSKVFVQMKEVKSIPSAKAESNQESSEVKVDNDIQPRAMVLWDNANGDAGKAPKRRKNLVDASPLKEKTPLDGISIKLLTSTYCNIR